MMVAPTNLLDDLTVRPFGVHDLNDHHDLWIDESGRPWGWRTTFNRGHCRARRCWVSS